MKSLTLRAKLDEIGISTSFNRPGGSNDNAYPEALFRTTKYRPDYPENGFATLSDAREWMLNFVLWYNTEHHHSAIKFVTPAQRHAGLDHQILTEQNAVYQRTKAKNPSRWSGNTHNWSPVGSVMLNPERLEKEQSRGQKMAV